MIQNATKEHEPAILSLPGCTPLLSTYNERRKVDLAWVTVVELVEIPPLGLDGVRQEGCLGKISRRLGGNRPLDGKILNSRIKGIVIRGDVRGITHV